MTRISRIDTDREPIRVNPEDPCHPCSVSPGFSIRPGRTIATGLVLVALLTWLTLVSNLLYRRYLTAASLPNGARLLRRPEGNGGGPLVRLGRTARSLARLHRALALQPVRAEPPLLTPLDHRGARELPAHGAAPGAPPGRGGPLLLLAKSAHLAR